MYKKAFKILKNNMIFIQPILIWQIVVTSIFVFTLNRIQIPMAKISMWISMILLFVSCLAGWFYINKYAVLEYDEKDSQEEITTKTVKNFKKFFDGVGSDFVRTLLASIVIVSIYYAVFYALCKFCVAHFGMPYFVKELVEMSRTGTQEQIIQYLNNLQKTDQLMFANWVITLNTGLSIVNLFALVYFTIMTFERKNFIISFFQAIKFYLLNLFEAVGIMVFMFFLYLVINLISMLLGANAFFFAIVIIIVTLYFNYYVLLVFCFYYDKTKNNSNNRTELVRENEAGDTFSKEI